MQSSAQPAVTGPTAVQQVATSAVTRSVEASSIHGSGRLRGRYASINDAGNFNIAALFVRDTDNIGFALLSMRFYF